MEREPQDARGAPAIGTADHRTIDRRGALQGGVAVGVVAALLLRGDPAAAAAPTSLDVFNVRDYGAVPDWQSTGTPGTDNRTTIRNAHNALVANGGGILYFPRGDQAAGHTGKYGIAVSSTSSLITVGSNTTVLFEVGVELHARSNSATNHVVFKVQDARNVVIQFATVVDHPTGGSSHRAIQVLGSEDVLVDWCTITGWTGEGIATAGTTIPSSRVRIFGSTITSCNGPGVRLGESTDVVVEGCTISSNTNGILLNAGSGKTLQQVRIVGNTFAGNTNPAIKVDPAPGGGTIRDVEVLANTFVGNARACNGGAERLALTANVVEGCANEGINVTSGTVSVVGNSVADNTGTGIVVQTANSLVTANLTDGLTVSGTNTLSPDNLLI
jgi:parallel beta-helix repeat protein